MSFLVEDSCLVVSHLLYKTALLITVLRWISSCILSYRNRYTAATGSSSRSSCSKVPSRTVKDNLGLTKFGDVRDRTPCVSDTCAVCLNHLEDEDEVRELRNCCHVFHKECIDRWMEYHDHDHGDDHHDDGNHRASCPLCRAPLLATPLSSPPRNEPSWAVERLLYLFGDDLLPS